MNSSPGLIRFLPVVFIVGIIFLVYSHYVVCYLPWRLSTHKSAGLTELIIFHVLVVLLCINYVLACVTPAGEIPDTEEWRFCEDKHSNSTRATSEKKRNGLRRHCKWCSKFKPDRTHHCRVCQRCVLKMDHHCPWIFNCVGFQNHKFFILLLVYTVASCAFVTLTLPAQWGQIYAETAGFFPAFVGTVVHLLCLLLGLVVGAFLGFHMYLTFEGLTTIEYCEKKRTSPGQEPVTYHRGFYSNFCAVFGNNPLLWLLPFSGGRGDGLTFATSDSGGSSRQATRKRIAARLSEKYPEEVVPMIREGHDSATSSNP